MDLRTGGQYLHVWTNVGMWTEQILVNPRFAPRRQQMRDSWKIAMISFRIDLKEVRARGV
jgi:hypothetical protein